jgi:hypothetical protein
VLFYCEKIRSKVVARRFQEPMYEWQCLFVTWSC